MPTKLARTGKRQTIKDGIVAWIRREGLSAGERIMSQTELARIFKTTQVTIHRALTELAGEGVVHRVKGKGTFVGPAPDGAGSRTLTLILPGEHLDDPARNPHAWPYVQTIIREFMSFAGTEWQFVPRGVRNGDVSPGLLAELADSAVVFFFHTREPRDLLEVLVRQGAAPVVAFGMPHADVPCLTVDHDRVTGVKRGVQHLLACGYRRIGFLGSAEFWGELALEGYTSALREAGIGVERKRIARTGDSREEASRGALKLTKRAPDCDALFVDSDVRALGAYDALTRRGVRVPEDLGLMGYDGVDIAVSQHPYLTTVAMPWGRMIAAAVDELAGPGVRTSPRKHVSIAGDVVVGRTTRRA